jgi:myo-inositol catabolism protein IolC
MKNLGYDRPLYLLPFDQRASFQAELFGWTGSLTRDQTAQIAASKQVIYDGFKAALRDEILDFRAGILVDEQFGAAILEDASTQAFAIACPAEKTGQMEFDFEYGEDFPSHIEAIRPSFCKVLVRYNPEGDAALNARQAVRLKRLSEYLHDKSHTRLMFELLVPAEEQQIALLNGDHRAYDRELRPRLIVRAIEQLQDAGVEPDIWGIEGLDRCEDCERVVAAARRNGRDEVSCIVLGRGGDEQVHGWLAAASGVAGFIGFTAGRTIFWDALVDWRAKKITREDAVNRISHRYRAFAEAFEAHAHAA